MLKSFKSGDVLHNRIETYPESHFFFYNSKIWYNEKPELDGKFTGSIYPNIGKVNLYEENVDRASNNLIYPFITKEGSLTSFKTISTTAYNSDFAYGDTLTGSYPLESGLTKTHLTDGQSRTQVVALRNSLNYYKILSPHYAYEGSLGNKSSQEMSTIDIPSIFYGSSIKKGSVSLRYYWKGSLISELRDEKRNGELIEVGPPGSAGSGSVAGVILYNEGYAIITGSWTLSSGLQWKRFANENSLTSSYAFDFKGVNYIPTITMLCHADKGELNHSNNPTYIKFGQTASLNPMTSSQVYREHNNLQIKNVVKSPFVGSTASFKKQTFISKVGIYDENKNLIAIAKLARPVRKREEDNFTFKLKLDI